jgi:hypothetical protein
MSEKATKKPGVPLASRTMMDFEGAIPDKWRITRAFGLFYQNNGRFTRQIRSCDALSLIQAVLPLLIFCCVRLD